MSRVGKSIIKIPPKVEVKTDADSITVKGPLGELKSPLYPGISAKVESGEIVFLRASEEQQIVSLHGLVRALCMNNVKGVTTGWEKNLEIAGVGYRAQKKGKDLVMNLGYSHEVVFPEPAGIKIDVADLVKIKITGIDRQLVGQVAADIRSKRPPEPYKAKGIKYANEYIRRKAGKTGKK